MNTGEKEPSVLARVRPAAWSSSDATAYEAVQRLADEALEECALREAAALTGGPVPDRPEAARWRTALDDLAAARTGLRPADRAALSAVRERCLNLLDQADRVEEIRAAIASGRARPLTPEAGQVHYAGTWWVRDGVGYRQLAQYAPQDRELTGALDDLAVRLAAADHAVAAEHARVRKGADDE
jgi:hypothetical protein